MVPLALQASRPPNGISIGSAVFERLTREPNKNTDIQTDRARYVQTSVTIGRNRRIYAVHVMRPKNSLAPWLHQQQYLANLLTSSKVQVCTSDNKKAATAGATAGNGKPLAVKKALCDQQRYTAATLSSPPPPRQTLITAY